MGVYRLLHVLGEGGMGIVYAAEHQASGARVALKVARRGDEPQAASIRREIAALSGLRHPGVVQLLEAGLDQGSPWYAMELLDGEAFGGARERRASSEGAASSGTSPRPKSGVRHAPTSGGRGLGAGGAWADALTTLRRLSATLAFVHGEGLVHRDVKPSNIVVRPGLRPVLIDFGLARRSDERYGPDRHLPQAGTASYMAPELFRGEPADERADLYALGCVLYEAIAGRPPFVGATTQEIREGHLTQEPLPLSEGVGGVPAALDELVLGLLAKSPRARVGHASDVERLLGELSVRREGAQASARRALPSLPGQAEARPGDEGGVRALRLRLDGCWNLESRREAGQPSGAPVALAGRRLSALSAGARRLAEASAVLGDEAPWGHVERLAGLDGAEAGAARRELVRARLLGEQGQPRLRDELRRAAYEQLDAERRAELHRQAARLLAGQPGADLRLAASHHASGHALPDAIACLERAGERSLGEGAHREAIECFEAALAIDSRASSHKPASWERTLALAFAEREGLAPPLPAQPAGWLSPATSPTRRLASLRRAGWLRRIGEAHEALGDLEGAAAHYDRALRLLGLDPLGAPLGPVGWLRQAALHTAHRLGLAAPPRDPAERAALAEAALLLGRRGAHGRRGR